MSGHSAGTLVLTRRDIAASMDVAAYLDAVETGFRAAAEGKAHAPPPMAIEGVSGAFHGKGASLQLDRLFVALKLNGNFPDNPERRGLPTIQGAILLCDGEDGSLLAIMDSIEITLRRTAAATALAARYLARADSQTLLICGCGAQALAQVDALRGVLPLRRCFAWDGDPAKANALADRLQQSAGIETKAVADLAGAALQSDVIVTCTTSRAPFLSSAMVRDGTFVAAVGADSPDKSEIAADLMARSLVVADVLAQCAVMGDLHHAIDAGTMTAANVHAELGELTSGRRGGRSDEQQVTLFDSTGTALQDVACAASIYSRSAEQPGSLMIDLAA